MKEIIPIINIITELKEQNFITIESKAEFHCKIFEDNSGALQMASAPNT